MKQSRVLSGYVFGSILALGGLACAVFVDKTEISRRGISGAVDLPVWILGTVVFVFGAVILVRTARLHRQK